MKLKVYVHSHKIPTDGFVDKEGAVHACARAQKTAYQGLQQFSSIFGNRYLSDEERAVLTRVEGYCKSHGLEFEVVDLGTLSFFARIKLKMKKTPAVGCGKKRIYGVASEDDLTQLLEER